MNKVLAAVMDLVTAFVATGAAVTFHQGASVTLNKSLGESVAVAGGSAVLVVIVQYVNKLNTRYGLGSISEDQYVLQPEEDVK